MHRFRALSAVVALAGLLLPWARVAVVSAHLSSAHHHAEASHHAADLEDSFHGHHHARGEAHHQHSLIGCDLVLQRSRTITEVLAPASDPGVGLPAIQAPARTGFQTPWETISDHGPPRGPRRAVLRI